MSKYLNRYVIIWKGGIRQSVEGTTLDDAVVRAGYDPDMVKETYKWEFANSVSRHPSDKGHEEDLDRFEINWVSGETAMLEGIDVVDALLRAGYSAIEGLYSSNRVSGEPKKLQSYVILWNGGVRQVIEGPTLKDAFSRIGYALNKIKGSYRWRSACNDLWKDLPDDSVQWLPSITGPEKMKEFEVTWDLGGKEWMEGTDIEDALVRNGHDPEDISDVYHSRELRGCQKRKPVSADSEESDEKEYCPRCKGTGVDPGQYYLGGHAALCAKCRGNPKDFTPVQTDFSDEESPEEMKEFAVTWYSGVTERIKGTSLEDAQFRAGFPGVGVKSVVPVQTGFSDEESPEELNKYRLVWDNSAVEVIEGTTLVDAFLRAGYDREDTEKLSDWISLNVDKQLDIDNDPEEMKGLIGIKPEFLDEYPYEKPEESSIPDRVMGSLKFLYEGGSSRALKFECALSGPISEMRYVIYYMSDMPSYTMVECKNSDIKLVIMGNQYNSIASLVHFTNKVHNFSRRNRIKITGRFIS